MIQRETLRDGSIRLRGATCTFVFVRLRPSVLLLVISGEDTGDLGSAPFEELEAEIRRFRQPLALFVDTRATSQVPSGVTDAWTAWFVANHRSLSRVSILVGSKPVQLAVSVVQHFSRTGTLMAIQSDLEEFEQSITRVVPGFRHLPPGTVVEEPANSAGRKSHGDGSVRLWGEHCSFVYSRPATGVVLLAISGYDTGELGTVPIDEVAEAVARSATPVELFVDTTQVTGTAERVMEEWLAWFQSGPPGLRRVHLLTGSPYLHLQVMIATYLTRLAGVITIHTDRTDFERALSRAGEGTTRPVLRYP
jgi:hypothetical protein